MDRKSDLWREAVGEFGQKVLLTLTSSVLAAGDVETRVTLRAEHQLLLTDQTGADGTAGGGVGGDGEDVLRAVVGAVRGELLIVVQSGVSDTAVEVVSLVTLLERKECKYRHLTEPSHLTLILQPMKAPISPQKTHFDF